MILSPSGGKSHLHLNRKMNPNWDFSSWNQQESNQVSAGVCLGIRQMNIAEDMHLHRFMRLILSMTILVHLLFPLLWIWKKKCQKVALNMNLLKRFSQQIRMLNDGFCWLFQACAPYFLITFTTIALSGPLSLFTSFPPFPVQPPFCLIYSVHVNHPISSSCLW